MRDVRSCMDSIQTNLNIKILHLCIMLKNINTLLHLNILFFFVSGQISYRPVTNANILHHVIFNVFERMQLQCLPSKIKIKSKICLTH